MSAYAVQRAPERIADLVAQGLDLVSFSRAATEIISPLVRTTWGRAGTR